MIASSELFEVEKSEALGVAYGAGVDMSAGLVGMVERDIRPEFILWADVGGEKQATYDYLPIMQAYLKANKFPAIQVVRYVPEKAPYETIEGNMVMNATLPGATFGRHSCTVKWKIDPQKEWERKNLPAGTVVTKVVGFEAGEEYRANRAHSKDYGATWYPLIEWGWDREECKARIREAGLPVPPKSSCIFCPNMKPEELHDLTDEERGRVMRVEVVAEPYNTKVHGLWRRARKRDGRPGSMTEYIIREGLGYVHPDDLEPLAPNPNCGKFKRGYTFNPPHNDESLSDLLGGCDCSHWGGCNVAEVEADQHQELIDSLPGF